MIFKKKLACVGLISVVLACMQSAFTDEAKNIKEEIKDLKWQIAQLEERPAGCKVETVHDQQRNNKLDKMVKFLKGVHLGGGITLITQSTHNANGDSLSKNGDDVTDASYSADLKVEKEFSNYGKAYLHFEGGNGSGVTDELQVFSNVNADATGDENFDLIEAWYEQYFTSISLTVTFGKLDATGYIDTNEYANDETVQFLGGIFKNSSTLEFPDDNGPGIRINLEPFEALEIEMIVMNATGSWEDFFYDTFFAGQVDFKPNLFSRSGNYRIYGWLNNKDHIKWDNPAKNKETGYGFGLSFDQELTDNLGVFIRYGWQNPKVYAADSDFSLEQSYSIGTQFFGSLWGRDNDTFGVAFGQIFSSDEYKKADNLKAESEKHLEAYYNFKVNEHLALSPDIQLIWDPYGGDAMNGDRTIFVGGLRAQVDF